MNSYEKLVQYVDAASDLAESVVLDIKQGKEYSVDTIMALSLFIEAAYAMKDMLDTIEEKKMKLN